MVFAVRTLIGKKLPHWSHHVRSKLMKTSTSLLHICQLILVLMCRNVWVLASTRHAHFVQRNIQHSQCDVARECKQRDKPNPIESKSSIFSISLSLLLNFFHFRSFLSLPYFPCISLFVCVWTRVAFEYRRRLLLPSIILFSLHLVCVCLLKDFHLVHECLSSRCWWLETFLCLQNTTLHYTRVHVYKEPKRIAASSSSSFSV